MPTVGDGHNVAVTGSTHDEFGIRFTANPKVHSTLVTRLVDKVRNNAESLMDFEVYNLNDCKVGVVSFGITSRGVYEAVDMATRKGIKVGSLRLRTIWPFPERAIKGMAQKAETIIVAEMNLQQLFFEVQRAVDGRASVVPLNKIGGGELLTPEEILVEIEGAAGGL